MEYIGAAAIFVVLLVAVTINNRRIEKQKILSFLTQSYGQPKEDGISYNHREQLKKLLVNKQELIPESVWNDLNMDNVFDYTDRSISAIGEEYLYLTLHSLESSDEKLEKRHKLSQELRGKDSFLKIKYLLTRVKKQEYMTIHGCIDMLSSVRLTGTFIYVTCLLLFVISFVLALVNSTFTLIPFIIATINILIYFSKKSSISGYDYAVESVVKWLDAITEIVKTDSSGKHELKELFENMHSLSDEFSSFRRFSWLLAPKNAVGSLADMLLDYIKFITHLDLIKFNLSVKLLKTKQKELMELYSLSGELELGFIIASVSDGDKQVCVPDFETRFDSDSKLFFYAECMTHPLLKEPVPNDCIMRKNILLTGSNASGKSTYLKMAGVNIILAQTLKIAFAKSLNMPFFDIRTSINISDDIISGDSFYLAEIKRLKSIIDKVDDDKPLFICIDEILKGTNTTERIAASVEILKYLAKTNALVLAATHDFELTGMLTEKYENYYFTENVSLSNIFDYKLRKGVVYNSNAIKLLERYEFPEVITKNSYMFIEEQNLQKNG